jgi:predicted nucleic acid-binding protein
LKTLTNTTVLSNFAAVGRLDLLQQLFGQIWITTEVYDELLDGLQEGYDFYTGIDQQIHPLANEGWIQLVSMTGEDELRAFRSLAPQLDTGEASCLAIARHRGWAFLSDDKLARKRARAWQIQLSGTLGVLVQAVKRRLLTAEAGDQLLQSMIQRGYHSPYDTLYPLLEDDQ